MRIRHGYKDIFISGQRNPFASEPFRLGTKVSMPNERGDETMKKTLLPLAAIAALGLAACSQNTQNETAQAADAIAADANATMSEAAGDVEAATDGALSSAENAADRAGAAIDRAGERADAAANRAGDRIEEGADRVGNAAQAADRELRR